LSMRTSRQDHHSTAQIQGSASRSDIPAHELVGTADNISSCCCEGRGAAECGASRARETERGRSVLHKGERD